MESLFAEAYRRIEDIGSLFGQLEKKLGHPDAIKIEETIKSSVDELNVSFDRLEIYVLKEPPSKRASARLKLNQLKYDSQHISASLRNFQKKRLYREQENVDREDLLNRRFVTNSEDTSINIDHSIQHNNSLHRAGRNVDEMINQGYNILGSMKDQRETLKKTQTRMLNFLNTLGLSNTVMRMIERRTYQDKFILFGGMFITSIILFFIYLYFV